MTKNQLSMLKTSYTPDDWLKLCPNYRYRIIKPQDYPSFVPSDIAEKSISGMVICSGSSDGFTAWFVPYRIDKDAIDTNPIIYSFNYSTGKKEIGIIHHGDWEGRSNLYPSGSMKAVMNSNGFDPSFTIKQFPDEKSGSIQDLVEGGYAIGFRKPEEIFQNKKGESK